MKHKLKFSDFPFGTSVSELPEELRTIFSSTNATARDAVRLAHEKDGCTEDISSQKYIRMYFDKFREICGQEYPFHLVR